MRMARNKAARQPWLAQLPEREPARIATLALANKALREQANHMDLRQPHHGTAALD